MVLELLPFERGQEKELGGKLGREVRAIGWAHVVAFLLALTVTLFGVNRHARFTKQSLTKISPARQRVSTGRSDLNLFARPIYPYSVIPGGVANGQELKDAIAHDAVAAGHYADFDVAKARVAHLDHDELAYVSYRMGDRIFWTSKKVKLPKGETVVTDGTHEARTRCGNRLSETPGHPVSPQEPPPQALEQPTHPEVVALLEPPTIDFPPTPPFLPPDSPPGPPPSNPPGGGIIPLPFFPPIGGGGSPPSPPRPAVAVPEPSSLGMLVASVATILAAGWVTSFRRRHKA